MRLACAEAYDLSWYVSLYSPPSCSSLVEADVPHSIGEDKGDVDGEGEGEGMASNSGSFREGAFTSRWLSA
jgi:hypothetical protein